MSGLLIVGAVNGSLFLFNRAAFVEYSLGLSSCLLVINALDPGVNQEIILGATRRTSVGLKSLLFMAASLIASVLAVSRIISPLMAVASSAYSAAFLAYTSRLTQLLAVNAWRSEALRKFRYSVIAALVVVPLMLLGPITAPALLITQAALMLSVALPGAPKPRNAPSTVSPVRQQPLTRWPLVLRNSLIRGAPLNYVSNGVLLIASATGYRDHALAVIRVGLIVTLLINALTPVGPQHYIRFSLLHRQRLRRALDGCTLAGFATLATMLAIGTSIDSIAVAIASGVTAGAPLTRISLYANSTTVDRAIARLVLVAIAASAGGISVLATIHASPGYVTPTAVGLLIAVIAIRSAMPRDR